MSNLEKKFKGAILGLAVGDALGSPIQFRMPGTFNPITDMIGGGHENINPGEWSDDTSLALCLAESFIQKKEFDARDQAERFCKWVETGHLSSRNYCFDLGLTTGFSLMAFKNTNDPFSGPTEPMTAGNGSIMRLAPVPLFYFKNLEKAIEMSGESSRTTHGARTCIDGCRYLGYLITNAANGVPKNELLSENPSNLEYWQKNPLCPEITEIAHGSFKRKNPPEIIGSGYVVKSLEAALWAFYNSHSFKECVLKAVNLGNDTDTTGAVAGQIAGSFYGVGGEQGIPEEWVNKLAKIELIKDYAQKLFEIAVSK